MGRKNRQQTSTPGATDARTTRPRSGQQQDGLSQHGVGTRWHSGSSSWERRASFAAQRFQSGTSMPETVAPNAVPQVHGADCLARPSATLQVGSGGLQEPSVASWDTPTARTGADHSSSSFNAQFHGVADASGWHTSSHRWNKRRESGEPAKRARPTPGRFGVHTVAAAPAPDQSKRTSERAASASWTVSGPAGAAAAGTPATKSARWGAAGAARWSRSPSAQTPALSVAAPSDAVPAAWAARPGSASQATDAGAASWGAGGSSGGGYTRQALPSAVSFGGSSSGEQPSRQALPAAASWEGGGPRPRPMQPRAARAQPADRVVVVAGRGSASWEGAGGRGRPASWGQRRHGGPAAAAPGPAAPSEGVTARGPLDGARPGATDSASWDQGLGARLQAATEPASAKRGQRLRESSALEASLREMHSKDAEARVRAAAVAANSLVARALAIVADAHASRIDAIRALPLAEEADAMDD